MQIALSRLASSSFLFSIATQYAWQFKSLQAQQILEFNGMSNGQIGQDLVELHEPHQPNDSNRSWNQIQDVKKPRSL